jgi:hypothetical protein
MTRDARIELTIWDGDYEFRLGWGELAQLQEKCDAGPYVILNRINANAWRMEDIEGVLRLGLIGAGRRPEDATKLIKDHVKTRPAADYVVHASVVLSAALVGASDEAVGEEDAANQQQISSTNSPTES